jgi:Protein of unknown function (DUF4019)
MTDDISRRVAMNYMFLFAMIISSMCLLGLPFQLKGDAAQPQATQNPDLTASAVATQAWLGTIDKGDYQGSWDQGSKIMQSTIGKDEWVNYLDAMRKPLGQPSGRQILDQRTSKDPQGLPAGDYMVLLYNTNFASKAGTKELVTLIKESDGQWKVLTYQIQ